MQKERKGDLAPYKNEYTSGFHCIRRIDGEKEQLGKRGSDENTALVLVLTELSCTTVQ